MFAIAKNKVFFLLRRHDVNWDYKVMSQWGQKFINCEKKMGNRVDRHIYKGMLELDEVYFTTKAS